MKKYNLNPRYLEKWIRQNGAAVLDIIDGVLLDNFLIECKRGAAVVKETYINSNMSGYTVYFSRDNKEIYNFWDEITR